MIGSQCKAARALLGIGQQELAEVSGTNVQAVSNFERASRGVGKEATDRIRRALEARGIEFLREDDGYGVYRVLRRDEREFKVGEIS